MSLPESLTSATHRTPTNSGSSLLVGLSIEIVFRLGLEPSSAAMAESSPSSSRRPYHGSCHCGSTKYVAFLSFPPFTSRTSPASSTRIYKCNCSICHKAGFFHIRLKSSPDDFILLSPLDPETGGLGDYTRSDGKTHWYFCKTCGVRCFSFRGTGEVVEVGEDGWGNDEGKIVRVWRPKKEGWNEGGGGSYLSVNAMTLEPGQDGFDLKEWTEKNWIWYLDMKDNEDDDRLGVPHNGGCY